VLEYLRLLYGWVGAGHPRLSVVCAGVAGAVVFAGLWYAVGIRYGKQEKVVGAPPMNYGSLPDLGGEITRLEVVPDRGRREMSRVYVGLSVVNRGEPTALTAWRVDIDVVGGRIQISEKGLRDWSAPRQLSMRGRNLLLMDQVLPEGGKCSGWLAFELPRYGLVGPGASAGPAVERVVIHFADVRGRHFSVGAQVEAGRTAAEGR
jgi:hypothetical protein